MEHWSLEAKNTGFVRIWLQKDAFRVDTFSVPPKKHKNASEFLIKTNKHIYTMSGRGKGKSSKKAVSRSAKAGLQFPVGRIARYVLLHRLHFLQSMMTRAIWMRWKCVRSSNTTILKLQALTLNSLSIHKQIPQGWQIRHPCWCRRPGLLGRGLGILSG